MAPGLMVQQFEILERKYRDQARDLTRVKDELGAEHGQCARRLVGMLHSLFLHAPHTTHTLSSLIPPLAYRDLLKHPCVQHRLQVPLDVFLRRLCTRFCRVSAAVPVTADQRQCASLSPRQRVDVKRGFGACVRELCLRLD